MSDDERKELEAEATDDEQESEQEETEDSNDMQIIVGAALLVAGTALILFVSAQGSPVVPGILGSLAALGVAAGTLLVGTSDSDGRPV